jgi:hypothetical protein
MIHKDIRNAIQSIRPGALWNLSGDELSGLIWLDKTQTRPTDAEITAAILAYIPPPTQEDRIAQLEAKVAALVAKQGK